MKTTEKLSVTNYIYDNYNERGSKAFIKKVAQLLKNNSIEGKIICHNAFMERGNGRGSYYKCAEIEINGEIEVLREHTNDSLLWDNLEEPTAKDKRNLFLAVLEETFV